VVIEAGSAAAAGVCVGLVRDRAGLPDVLHPPQIRRQFRLSPGMRIGLMAGVIVALLVVWSQIALADRRNEAAGLKTQLDRLKPRADQAAKDRAGLAAVNQWMDERFAWIDLFNALQGSFDRSKMYLTGVTAGDSGWVFLRGKAADDKTVTQYVGELQKLTGLVKEVVADGITSTADPGSYKKDFSIRVRVAALTPPGKK